MISVVTLDLLSELIRVCTSNYIDLLSTSKELECWHGCDLVELSNIFAYINVDLLEHDINEFRRHSVEDWRNLLARWTPSSCEVNYDNFASSLLEDCLELKQACDIGGLMFFRYLLIV